MILVLKMTKMYTQCPKENIFLQEEFPNHHYFLLMSSSSFQDQQYHQQGTSPGLFEQYDELLVNFD